MATPSKLDSSTMLYILISILCMLAFFTVGIYPNLQQSKALDLEIAHINTQVKEQTVLFPLYTRLIKAVQNDPPTLPLPPKATLAPEDIAGLDDRFSKLAEKNGLVFDSAVPDPVSYLEDSGQLTMNLAVHGDFFNFQKLLVDICQLPYVAAIDELGITPHQDSKQMALKLRLNQK